MSWYHIDVDDDVTPPHARSFFVTNDMPATRFAGDVSQIDEPITLTLQHKNKLQESGTLTDTILLWSSRNMLFGLSVVFLTLCVLFVYLLWSRMS